MCSTTSKAETQFSTNSIFNFNFMQAAEISIHLYLTFEVFENCISMSVAFLFFFSEDYMQDSNMKMKEKNFVTKLNNFYLFHYKNFIIRIT